MCADHPTGVSVRHQVTIDGEISCNSFGYCKDGDYIIEECTPGQYFDGGPSKLTYKYKYDEVPLIIIFKILASQLMKSHAELHVQIHAHLHHLTQCV